MDSDHLSHWKDKKVLLIDDFSSMRQMLRDTLRVLGVRHIEQVGSGDEAISMLQRLKFDVVLCDYNLGDGKNGQQVLEEVKVRDLTGPSCIWLMVSVEKSVESVMGAAEHQPDGYLIKPITEAILLTRLNRIVQKKHVFKAIDEAVASGQYITAAKLCEERSRSNKLHVIDLLRLRARLLIKAGEFDLAKDTFDQILREREFPWAKTGIAKVKMEKGDFVTARTILHEVMEANPNYMEAYDALAECLLKLGENEEAKTVLAAATKLSPNSVTRQLTLGDVAMKLGDIPVAEKAYRRSVAVGEHSIKRTPESYFGLARVCGQKGEAKEALRLLTQVQQTFVSDDVRLRAKITEGMVYHESGDWRAARKAGEELAEMLEMTSLRPKLESSLELAKLMFAVGVKEAGADLISDIVKNNFDKPEILEQCQEIFEKGRMGDEGEDIIGVAKREATEMMNKGLLLWKAGQMDDAVEWMRGCRPKLAQNVRFLLNYARLLVAYIAEYGPDTAYADEARAVLAQVDRLSPNHKRHAEMLEQLGQLMPDPSEAAMEEEGQVDPRQIEK